MRNFSSSSNHRQPPPSGARKPYHRNNNRPSDPNNHRFVSGFQAVNNPNYRRRFPPAPSTALGSAGSDVIRRPNFIIQLLHDYSPSPSEPNNLQALISQLDTSPESSRIFTTGKIAASLTFQEWNQTLSSILHLWRSRLDGSHHYTPMLIPNIIVPSDAVELEQNLKTLFSTHIAGLMGGELVKKWQKKINEKSDEITKLSAQMGKRNNSVRRFYELNDTKKALIAERSTISKRLREFKGAMGSLLRCLEDGVVIGNEVEEDKGVEVFRVEGELDWKRIHQFVLRECKRLEDGLPIYAYRQEILTRIHCEQIMVLIGETGSGKSTQLVQFLSDSGIAANESIVCTQPRKIAAISLAKRVREESIGCYNDNSVTCYPTFSSAQQFDSKVIYMTDHCLLQHYMNDRNLSGISCIIVDEAHERSLNTDLLLALLKDLLGRRVGLRLVIMSATANANQLSDYFFGCGIFHLEGRNFPVHIKYVPCTTEGTYGSGMIPTYVSDVLRMAAEVHKTKKEGNILAFLTSQMEVEWACDHFEAPNVVVLPLHGKLSFEEQCHVFQNYPGKRKLYLQQILQRHRSQFVSSANQRAGRAGRTEPGRCYRLYTASDFELMAPNQEPEIRRVHLGIAVLRILALGIKNVQSFDFVDAPSPKAIDSATRNLVQLGAIVEKNGVFELTDEGRYLVKLGIEPRLGKLMLTCFHSGLRREGLVLAAVMANASSIFAGWEVMMIKRKLIVLRKNNWCWENSINAKSMRRCQDTVFELEICLKKELAVIIPSYLIWDPHKSTERDKILKAIILSSLAENVAMYSGHDQLGYEVALTGQHVQLHPSCSLLIFGEKPSWVVFGELLSVNNQYLVCVTAFDFESLATLDPPPLFDASLMESRKLQVGVEVNVDQNVILLFASSVDMQKVLDFVTEVVECEKKWLLNECMEKPLFHGRKASPSMALFGAGAEIKHLEVDKRYLSVDVFHSNVNTFYDMELLMLFEDYSNGSVCSVNKSQASGKETDEKEKWGKITFLTPDAARKAAELDGLKFAGSSLKVLPSQTSIGGDHKMFSFPAVKAKVNWPRRVSKGFGIIKCNLVDVRSILDDFSSLVIADKYVRCEVSRKCNDSIMIYGIDKDLSEAEIWDILCLATERKIHDFFLVRGDAVENPTCDACEKALLREISPFMPKGNPYTNCCQVQVFEPEPRETFMKALITFDGRLHLEAAKALEQLEGKVLPGCLSWQKIRCQQQFHSSISCSSSVYAVIKKQLNSLLESFSHVKGADCFLEENENGSCRIRISANATKTVAELRRSVEELMNGSTVKHASLTPSILQHLFSRDGINLMRSLQRETRTYIFFDRHSLNVRIFGSSYDASVAQQKLIQSLLSYHESKQLEVRLRGRGLPPDMMKEVVKKFGPDLHGLKEKIPGAEFTLNTRHHIISIRGDKEMKQKVEEIVLEIAKAGRDLAEISDSKVTCPICLCEVEDGYRLEGCSHLFCHLCLVEQCESAIRNSGSFPVCCARQYCKAPILLTDLKSLLSTEKLEELFRASLGALLHPVGVPFGFALLLIAPLFIVLLIATLPKYREFKEDPDSSLKEWCKGKDQVKTCPVCGYTIEKTDGCNHVECKCGRHVCWVCLEFFSSSDNCYSHLRAVHMTIT
ncbi:Helicase domain-containing protein [Hibiscus syriacus]|uniref:RNA helicase n=1 Tax=Hibiscus syriacus TaxID=106335 RepID=A0A6A3AAU5_HIBSY|nr:Helicase domain-containing protein [Hibiscus syriacus]